MEAPIRARPCPSRRAHPFEHARTRYRSATLMVTLLAKLPSRMTRPDTKEAGWWQQSGWSPPSARTPLVANPDSTCYLPDTALPSGGGVGSGGLPMLHGIQLKAKRAMLATTPSSPQSRTLCSGEITRVWRAEKLLRSPPKHVDALNHWAFPNLSSNDKSRPQNRGSSRRILPRAFGLLARATTHPNSESCPGIHIWTRQLDSSTARAQHRGGLRRFRLRRQPACLPCPTAYHPCALRRLHLRRPDPPPSPPPLPSPPSSPPPVLSAYNPLNESAPRCSPPRAVLHG